MNRRILLASLLATTIAPPAVAQSKLLSLNDISLYLNELINAKGDFTQINPDGSISKGTFFLKRPGRMRFEYHGRDAPLVVAGQGHLAIFDKKSNAGPQQYPLRSTPLHIILQKDVDLNRSGMITGHSHDGKATSIVAQDPEHPGRGNVKLVFTDSPTELREWIVTDETGRQTTVILGELDKVSNVPARLFDIKALIQKNDVQR